MVGYLNTSNAGSRSLWQCGVDDKSHQIWWKTMKEIWNMKWASLLRRNRQARYWIEKVWFGNCRELLWTLSIERVPSLALWPASHSGDVLPQAFDPTAIWHSVIAGLRDHFYLIITFTICLIWSHLTICQKVLLWIYQLSALLLYFSFVGHSSGFLRRLLVVRFYNWLRLLWWLAVLNPLFNAMARKLLMFAT